MDTFATSQGHQDQLFLIRGPPPNKFTHTREVSEPVATLFQSQKFGIVSSTMVYGLSSLLVSMTVFEFICAQAPRTTQGLLIGLWYATFSIRYLAVGILDNLITERRSWLIYEGMKGFLILVSLVLFWCVFRRYRYRQRDEIVNVQGMIEDTHDKWLDQEEEYMQEQREFYQTTTMYNTVPLYHN